MAKEKHLVLDNDGFFVKGERFALSDVVTTEFYYVVTQKKQNFFDAGVDHNVEISIYLQSRPKPLKITTGPSFLTIYGLTLGKEATDALIAKFNELSARTFQQRADKYMTSLSQHGYFHYDGKKIYEDGSIEAPKWGGSFTQDKPWMRQPFLIYFEKRPSAFLRPAVRHEISTLKDSDVFFGLLKHLFKLHWA